VTQKLAMDFATEIPVLRALPDIGAETSAARCALEGVVSRSVAVECVSLCTCEIRQEHLLGIPRRRVRRS
jgi:hypothetical protein